MDDLKIIIPSESRPKKKKKKSYCMISFISKGKLIYSNKKQICGDLGMWGHGAEGDEQEELQRDRRKIWE